MWFWLRAQSDTHARGAAWPLLAAGDLHLGFVVSSLVFGAFHDSAWRPATLAGMAFALANVPPT